MSNQLQDVVRCLQAAGSTATQTGMLCLLNQDDDRLLEDFVQDGELQDSREVVEGGVREGTSAVNLAMESKVW